MRTAPLSSKPKFHEPRSDAPARQLKPLRATPSDPSRATLQHRCCARRRPPPSASPPIRPVDSPHSKRGARIAGFPRHAQGRATLALRSRRTAGQSSHAPPREASEHDEGARRCGQPRCHRSPNSPSQEATPPLVSSNFSANQRLQRQRESEPARRACAAEREAEAASIQSLAASQRSPSSPAGGGATTGGTAILRRAASDRLQIQPIV